MKRSILGVLLLTVAVIVANPALGAVWYVDDGIGTSGDGTSWGTAFETIQEAIDAAGPGDEAWVKAGTYTLSAQIDVDEEISLYGGFAGSETALSQRDWETNVTTIDGNDAVRCLYVTADNVTLDGFTVTRGYTDGTIVVSGAGMQNGVWMAGLINTSVANCIFADNTAAGYYGGAIFNDEGNLTVTNSTFTGNSSARRGGAIYSPSIGTLDILNCEFDTNSAGNGGALFLRDAAYSVTILDSTFSGNSAVSADGAAIVCDPDATITGCRFLGNTAVRYGTIATYGDFDKTLAVINTIFADNSVEYGGGVCINGSSGDLGSVIIVNSTFTGNTASGNGGALYSRKGLGASSVFTVTNSILWGDSADEIAVDTGAGLPTVSYSDVDQAGYAGTNGNISQDPGLDGNYHLTAGSPCIDAGDNTASLLPATDIDGEARKLDGDGNGSAVVDMGADEAPAASTDWTTASTIPGHAYTRQELDASHALNVLAMLLLPMGALALYGIRRTRD
jgi:predicted outer membrane repeat protein